MSRAVMQSIRPKWCELIASGRKTLEVRKTRPKLDPPFVCYIYCTKGGEAVWTKHYERDGYLNGKVIGEFVCDRIDDIMISCTDPNMRGIPFPGTGMSDREIMDYLGNGKTGYGWHISELVIYDQPRELHEFTVDGVTHMERPPQSWCYVEELG